MKTIALFGSTGQTGNQFLNLALANNYKVKALVRNPDKLTMNNSKLEVICGDILNEENVLSTIKDCDIVVSLFGHIKGSPEWLQTNGTKNIINAMKVVGVKKIISLSGGGLPFPEKDQPKFADKLIRGIMKILVPKVLNDAIKHHTTLVDSQLDWIIVRGPRLTNDAKLNKYRVGWVGVNASSKIARADIADFILTQVEDNTFIHQMPFISN